MKLKDKFQANLRKKLNLNQKQLAGLIEIVGVGNKSIVFQMPKGVIALDSIWEKIEETALEMKIQVSQMAGEYATLDDLDKILGEIEWLWKDWIPKGFVSMLAGDPGVGKSALIQHFVKIITTGGTFPLEEKPFGKPGNVIWIDTEGSQQILKVRANTMEIDKNRVYIPLINGDMLAQPDLAINNNKTYIAQMIQDLKPVLLVLDSLGGSHTRGENKVEDIRPILEFLVTLARDYQMAVVVIHHLNKGRQDESPEISLYRLRGSTVIPAMCRSIMAIEPTHDKKLKLRVVKTNIAKYAEPIGVIAKLNRDGDFTGFEYTSYTPPPMKRNKKEIVADWVMGQLNSKPQGVPVTELCELGEPLGFTRQNIYACRELLGEKVLYGGTGAKAYWYTFSEDKVTLKNIQRTLGTKQPVGITSNGKHHKEIGNGKSKDNEGDTGQPKAKAGRGGHGNGATRRPVPKVQKR